MRTLFLLLGILFAAQPALATDFNTSLISDAYSVAPFGPAAVVVSRSDNAVHTAFTAYPNKLVYAKLAGGSWTFEDVVVDSLIVGVPTLQIALGSDEQPRILYTASYANVKLATRTSGGSWASSLIAQGNNAGTTYSLAIDSTSNNTPHVSMDRYDASKDRYVLSYAYRDTAWHFVDVDTMAAGWSYSSIALASDGTPRIAYAQPYGVVTYATADTNNVFTLDPLPSIFAFLDSYDLSLALDPNTDEPRILHINPRPSGSGSRIVHYTAATDTGWRNIFVDGGLGPAVGTLRLTSDGYPRITFTHYTGSSTTLSVYAASDSITPSTFAMDTLDFCRPSAYSGIALRADNTPVIAYTEGALALYPMLATATSDAVTPAAISDLDITSANSSSATLAWTAVGDDGSAGVLCDYDIRYSTTEITTGNWFSAAQQAYPSHPDVAGEQAGVHISGLTSGIKWYFAVRGIDEAGNYGSISNVACVKIASPAELCDFGARARRISPEGVSFGVHHVYPNPSSSYLDAEIGVDPRGEATLGLYDVSGRALRAQKVPTGSGDLQVVRMFLPSSIRPGIYYLRLRSGEQVQTRTVVVR